MWASVIINFKLAPFWPNNGGFKKFFKHGSKGVRNKFKPPI